MVKKILAGLAALLVPLGALTVAPAAPAEAAGSRFVWTACGNNQFRQVGPNDSRIMKFQSCMRLHQKQNMDGSYSTDYIDGHGEVRCRVNVPQRVGNNTDIAERFKYGTNHSCSVRVVVGTNFANGEEPGDGDSTDQWGVRDADGIWVRCLGDQCSSVNSYWSTCRGFDIWHIRYDWIDVGLDNYTRDGVVAQSRSLEYAC